LHTRFAGLLLQQYPSLAPRYRIVLTFNNNLSAVTAINRERARQMRTRENLQR